MCLAKAEDILTKKFTPLGFPWKNVEDVIENAILIEDWIEKARENNYHIEAITLIHNTIEHYLRTDLIRHLMGEPPKQLDQKKLEILMDRTKGIIQYAEMCYLLDIITKEQFDNILAFNSKRNEVIHRLLRTGKNYDDLKEVVKLGKEIQLRLSPIDHTEDDIKRIVEKFKS